MYSFRKQHYKQRMPAPLQSQPIVCGFNTFYATFHLFKFRQQAITGVHDDWIREESKAERNLLRTEDCKDDFTANATTNFFPRTCCTKHMKHDKREIGLFKEEFRCTEMLCLCSKTYCCYDSNSNKYNFSSKDLNKRTLEDCGDGRMAKYRKFLGESINVTSTNGDFRTVHHSLTTYEQTKKGLSFFLSKENCRR